MTGRLQASLLLGVFLCGAVPVCAFSGPVSAQRVQAGQAASVVDSGQTPQFFVRNPGGSDAADGLTWQTAWLTLAKVLATVSSGDTVNMVAGSSWSEVLTPVSGVTYRAYGTGAPPLITGVTDCVLATSVNNVVLDGLHCTAFTGRGVRIINGDGWTLRNLFITGGDGLTQDFGVQVQNTVDPANLNTGLVIEYCEFGTIGTAEDDSVNKAAIQVGGVTGARIQGNLAHTTHVAGIRLLLNSGSPDNTGVMVLDNQVRNSASGILVFNTDDSIVARNEIWNGVGLGIGVAFDSDGVTLESNYIHDLTVKTANLWNGIDVNGSSENGQMLNNRIERVVRHSVVFDSTDTAALNWRLRNNLLDASGNSAPDVGPGLDYALPLGVRRDTILLDSDFNTFIHDDPDVVRYGVGDGTAYTLPEWQVFSGDDLNSTVSVVP